MSDFLDYINEHKVVSEKYADHKDLTAKYKSGKMTIQQVEKELEKKMSKDEVRDFLKKLVEASSCSSKKKNEGSYKSSKKKYEEYEDGSEEGMSGELEKLKAELYSMKKSLGLEEANEASEYKPRFFGKHDQIISKSDMEAEMKKRHLKYGKTYGNEIEVLSKKGEDFGFYNKKTGHFGPSMKMRTAMYRGTNEGNYSYKSEEVSVSKVIKDLGDTDWGEDNESQMKAVQLLKGLAVSDDPMANKFMKAISDASTDIVKKMGSTEKVDQVVEGSVGHASSILDGVQEPSMTQISDSGKVVRPREAMSSVANKACDILG